MQHSHNEIHNEQSANTPHSPKKLATNNPQRHHIHQRNTQRTIRKDTTFTKETRNKQSANTQLPPTKFATNNPSGIGADSSCPYFYIIKYAYSFHKIRTFVPSNTHFRTTFRGCIRICGHDKSAPTAAYKLPKYCEQIGITQHSPMKYIANNPQIHHIHQRNSQRTIRKYTTPTNETRNEHPVRRRGRFIAPVS